MTAKSARHWLMKSEPTTYSIDQLAKDKRTAWTGVRNYQARNFMMHDMHQGDLVLFYHSNAEPPGVAGLAQVCAAGHPDPSDDTGVWHCVDVKFVKKFKKLVELPALRANKKLSQMLLLQKGSRLSITPVTAPEFKEILKMAGE